MAIIKPHPEAVEVRELRTKHSKTFRLLDGQHQLEVRREQVHYLSDEGELRTCDTTLKQEDDGISAERLPYRFKLHEDGIGFDFESREGGTVSLWLEKIGNELPQPTYSPTVDGNTITFEEVLPGCNIVFKVLPERVKTLRILKDAKSPRNFEWKATFDSTVSKEKIDTSLIGFDAKRNQLELVAEVSEQATDTLIIKETWTGKVKVKNRKTHIKSLSDEISYPVTIDPTVTSNPGVAADDGYEVGGLGLWQNGIGLQIGSYVNSYHTGIRFPTINIPQGSTITSATLSLNVVGTYLLSGTGKIYAKAVDNATAFSATNLPSAAAKTTAFTSVPPPGSNGVKTYTITAVIQEIINRAGWVANNAIAIPIMNSGALASGTIAFEDVENIGTNPPGLSITYSSGVVSSPMYHYLQQVAGVSL